MPPARDWSGPALRVLVVEDDRAIANALCAGLRRRGHDVSLALDVEQALGLPEPQVLVADVRLSGSDGSGGASGLDLLETLRERGARTQAVLISGLPDFEDCRRALRLGASEFLPKPFGLDALIEAVERAGRTAPAHGRGTPAPADSLDAFERVYPCTPSTVHAAARDVAAFALRAGAGPVSRFRIASACAELLDNAVRHSGRDASGRIAVRAERLPHVECGLQVRIEDDGEGFDAVGHWIDSTPSLVAEEDAARGAQTPVPGGLARAAALAEDLRIESRAGSTVVTLRFDCAPAAFGEEAGIDLSELDHLVPRSARRVLEAVRGGSSRGLVNVSPGLAVAIGRLLTGKTPAQVVQTAIWS